VRAQILRVFPRKLSILTTTVVVALLPSSLNSRALSLQDQDPDPGLLQIALSRVLGLRHSPQWRSFGRRGRGTVRIGGGGDVRRHRLHIIHTIHTIRMLWMAQTERMSTRMALDYDFLQSMLRTQVQQQEAVLAHRLAAFEPNMNST